MEEVGFTVDDSDIYEDHRVTVDRKMKSGGFKDVTFWLARLKTPKHLFSPMNKGAIIG